MKQYFLTLITVVFFTAVLTALFGRKKGGIVRLICGVLIFLTAIAPIAKLDTNAIAKAISNLQLQEIKPLTEPLQKNRELVSAIISERTTAYIWDKATQLGFTPQSVEVQTADEEPPYPISVRIAGDFTPPQKQTLSALIATELAIPAASQEWIWKTSEN